MKIGKRRLNEEEFEYYKDNLMEFEEFRNLVRKQRLQLFEIYDKKYTNEELLQLWNCKRDYLYYVRNDAKKILQEKEKKNKVQKVKESSKEDNKKIEKEIDNKSNENKNYYNLLNYMEEHLLDQIDNKMNQHIEQMKVMNENEVAASVEQEESTGFELSFHSTDKKFPFHSDEIEKRLNKVIHIIQGTNSYYDIDFKLKEKEMNQSIDHKEVEEPVKVEKNVNELESLYIQQQEQIEKLREELEEEKSKNNEEMEKELEELKSKVNELNGVAEGYQSFKSDKGLHHPESEFKKKVKV